MLIAGDLEYVNFQRTRIEPFLLPSGIETWIRQSQEFLVTVPHEVHEGFLSWSDGSASCASVFSECDIGIEAVDQNEPRVQGDYFCQLVLSEGLGPRQADVDLLHFLCARCNRQVCISSWGLQADNLLKSHDEPCRLIRCTNLRPG